MPIHPNLNSILNSRFPASPYVAFNPLVHNGYHQRTEGSRTRIDENGDPGDPRRISRQSDECVPRRYRPTQVSTRGDLGVQLPAPNAVYGDSDIRRRTQALYTGNHRYTDMYSQEQGDVRRPDISQHLWAAPHSYNPHGSQALESGFRYSYSMDRDNQGPPGGQACTLIDDADPERPEAFEMDSSLYNRSMQCNPPSDTPVLEYECITVCVDGRKQEYRIPVDGQRARVGDTRFVPVPVYKDKEEEEEDRDEDADSKRTMITALDP